MFIGIIFGIVTVVLCIAAISIFERDVGKELFDFARVKYEQMEQSILAGFIIALICILYNKALWLAVVCYFVVLALEIVLAKWWRKEGSDFFEMLPFILLSVVFYNIMTMVGAVIAKVTNEFIGSVVTTLPRLILIISIGYFVVELYMYREKEDSEQ